MGSTGELSLEAHWLGTSCRRSPWGGSSQISEGGRRQHSELDIKQIRSNGRLVIPRPSGKERAGGAGIASEQALAFPSSRRAPEPCSNEWPPLKPH